MRKLALKMPIATAVFVLASAVTALGQVAGDRIEVRLENQSQITFTKVMIQQLMADCGPANPFGDIGYTITRGSLPLAPGKELGVLFALCGAVSESLFGPGDVMVDLSPACPPGVCNYSARCWIKAPRQWPKAEGFTFIASTNYVLGAPKNTPVGPMTSCRAGS